MAINRTNPGRIRPLLVVLVAVTAFYAGQHVWPNKVRPREAPPAGPVSIAPTEAGPAMPKDREVMAALQAPPQSVLHPVSPSSALLTEIDLMIRQGKLLEAQRKLEALGPDALSDMAARSNVATLWNNVGVGQARAAGEMSHGAAAFKNAVTIDPRNATAFMNLVLAYWESKSPALTTEMLEEAARLVPEDPMPHIILAERSIEKDDLSSATAHLELARARSAAFPQSQAYLKSQIDYLERARRSEQKFQSRDSSHFTVKYDGGEDYEVWANGAPPLRGVDAAIEAMRGALARYHVEQGFEPLETVIAGDWAFERGIERMTVTPLGGGAPQTIEQRAFLILRRGADRQWQYARGMTNGLPPVAPSDSVGA